VLGFAKAAQAFYALQFVSIKPIEIVVAGLF
jgi:hypothetical protein